jgi:beta-aspartyl-peptidase (threonine type)
MNKRQEYAIVVHGGAKSYSKEIEDHLPQYEKGIRASLEKGADVLSRGGLAVDAVQEAVIVLEDDPFFNAWRGSALNDHGDIEMDACIANGENQSSGAVAMISSVKNPILLARAVMDKTPHMFLAGEGAMYFAHRLGVVIKDAMYFKTDVQYASFLEALRSRQTSSQVKVHGTVGGVAVDMKGNVAAATSTGGTTFKMKGRIGDSCLYGIGCYADNDTCAISATGNGEAIIKGVVAHDIAAMIKYGGLKLQHACDEVVHEAKNVTGEFGVIAVDRSGDVAISFNSGCMVRGIYRSGEEIIFKVLE